MKVKLRTHMKVTHQRQKNQRLKLRLLTRKKRQSQRLMLLQRVNKHSVFMMLSVPPQIDIQGSLFNAGCLFLCVDQPYS
jgi:hypothetical protein